MIAEKDTSDGLGAVHTGPEFNTPSNEVIDKATRRKRLLWVKQKRAFRARQVARANAGPDTPKNDYDSNAPSQSFGEARKIGSPDVAIQVPAPVAAMSVKRKPAKAKTPRGSTRPKTAPPAPVTTPVETVRVATRGKGAEAKRKLTRKLLSTPAANTAQERLRLKWRNDKCRTRANAKLKNAQMPELALPSRAEPQVATAKKPTPTHNVVELRPRTVDAPTTTSVADGVTMSLAKGRAKFHHRNGRTATVPAEAAEIVRAAFAALLPVRRHPDAGLTAWQRTMLRGKPMKNESVTLIPMIAYVSKGHPTRMVDKHDPKATKTLAYEIVAEGRSIGHLIAQAERTFHLRAPGLQEKISTHLNLNAAAMRVQTLLEDRKVRHAIHTAHAS